MLSPRFSMCSRFPTAHANHDTSGKRERPPSAKKLTSVVRRERARQIEMPGFIHGPSVTLRTQTNKSKM